jgi:uncharacterized protein with gpF-like domain
MTRQQRIRQNERLRNKFEKSFYAPVKKALKSQLSSFTSNLKQVGPQAALTLMNSELWNQQMVPVINQLYVTAGLAKANQTLGELRRLPKVQKKRTSFGFNAEWTTQILEYFAAHLFDKVVLPISETTREYIEKVISKGVEEGWSIQRMVEEIEREDYLDGRVRRILRTETNRAINYGNELAAEKFDYKTQKRWIAVHDSRTRHAHMAADNQMVNQADTFSVGGEQLQFPGDPNGSPENTINCRCFSEVVAMRDDKGRLIPKDAQPAVRVRGALRAELQSILADLIN